MRMPATFAAGIRKRKPMRVGLEEELHAELHGPGIAGRADSSVHSAGDVQTRNGRKVCVIENIEDLPTQLDRL